MQFLKELTIAKKYKKKSSAPGKSTGKTGGRVTTKKISFDSDSDSHGEPESDTDYTPEYMKIEDDLAVELTCIVCQKKDPKRLCLLDKHGKHHVVSREMLRTWVTAIVSGLSAARRSY